MNPVVTCSGGIVSLTSGSAFSARKNNYLTILNFSRKSVKHRSSTQRFLLPPFVSIGLLPPNKRRSPFHQKSRTPISATETEVAVEEPDSPVADEGSAEASEAPSEEVGISEHSSPKSDANPASTKARLSRSARKSEMPPIKNEDLIPGATFTGKVKSIQPFGAFVDFGAFTDGLVHVSRLSDSYVKDVASVVSVGQEVKVKLIEVNTESRRISLSMCENDDIGKLQQQKDALISTEKAGPGRRNTSKPSSKKDDAKKNTRFVKGHDLEGTVKNMTRSGAFISLPDGEEGFLPISEESDEGFGNVMGTSSLQVGQEISVRVLRIARGQVTLTMKKEEDVAELDTKLSQGVVHVATNPFVLAFRDNTDIAAFLDEREKIQTALEKPSTEEIKGTVRQRETVLDVPDLQDEPTESSKKLMDDVPSAVEDNAKVDNSENKVDVGANSLNIASTANGDDERGPVSTISSPISGVDGATEKEAKVTSGTLAPEGDASTATQIVEEATQIDVTASNVKIDPSLEIANENVKDNAEDDNSENEADVGVSSTDGASSAIVDDERDPVSNISSPMSGVDDAIEKEAKVTSGSLATEEDTSTANKIIEEATQPDVSTSNVETDSPFEIANENVIGSAVDLIVEDEKQSQTSNVEEQFAAAAPTDNNGVEPSPSKNGNIIGPDIISSAPAPQETAGTISPALVKQLREETGAGMMDCKKALSETGGDVIKAQEFLRKKGLASAEKKASRVTAEGRIGFYIHDSRIGVLIEVNCETDFVSRGEIFKELVDDIAMQVAACPQVEYLVTEDVPEEIVTKEKEIEMQKEDLLSKPEQISSKIVEGRIRKRLEELALLEQPYIKNDKVAVKDWVKQTIATIGENIKVKRFVRFNLGEGLEKKSQDFAAEVAAQTAAKSVPTPATMQPAIAEAKETEQKPSTVAVSATLVKQLREETGAGMMDCKKALTETGGDLEKAQEYLRKKGFSTADKKSSRLAAEGRIGSYIHDSRIGVLIEVNCETDFVGRSEKFKELVDDLAMQVVACPHVQFVSIEDIPESILKKEKELEMQREDLFPKPENIREKIVEGRVSKRLGELALLEQPFIKDDSVLIKDLVKQTVAAIGENIKVRRFVRFTLGETVESETTLPA